MTTTPLTRYRFTVKEFHRMGEAGIFTEDDRVELIEGEIIELTPVADPHIGCVDGMTDSLLPQLTGRAIVRVQSPIPPGPGLGARARLHRAATPSRFLCPKRIGGPRRRVLHHRVRRHLPPLRPRGEGSYLCPRRDPEYWLVDLGSRTVTLFREPAWDGYRSVRELQGDVPLSEAALASVC